MKIRELKEILNMLNEDCQVYIRTEINDFATPLDLKRISIGTIEQQNLPTLFLTAFIPFKETNE